MDSVSWYRLGRHCSNGWVIQRPNKRVFSAEKRRESLSRATRISAFLALNAAFWFLFFTYVVGQLPTDTYLFASGATSLLSLSGRGWGVLEKILK